MDKDYWTEEELEEEITTGAVILMNRYTYTLFAQNVIECRLK